MKNLKDTLDKLKSQIKETTAHASVLTKEAKDRAVDARKLATNARKQLLTWFNKKNLKQGMDVTSKGAEVVAKGARVVSKGASTVADGLERASQQIKNIKGKID